MTNKKKLLVAASIAGLMASTSVVAHAGSAFPGQDAGNKSRCDMHGCKGTASCKGEKNSCKSHCNFGKGKAEAAAAATDGTLAGK